MVKKDKKLKVLKTISTINGTLYEGETVRFQRKEDGHYRVKDAIEKCFVISSNKSASQDTIYQTIN